MAGSSLIGALAGSSLLLGLALAATPSAARAPACADDEAGPDDRGSRSFLGYVCRESACGAHKAGFAWADRHGITDPAECVGADEIAFVEGCRAFVEHAVTAEQSGFEWARQNQVPDDCLCDGAGSRFAAGCEAYVRGFGH